MASKKVGKKVVKTGTSSRGTATRKGAAPSKPKCDSARPSAGSKPTAKVRPSKLRVAEVEGLWGLFHGATQVLTQGGLPVRHANRKLLARMKEEFDARGAVSLTRGEVSSPRFIGLYSYYEVHHDWVLPGKDDLTTDFESCITGDPLLRDAAGPERAEQLGYYAPIYRKFSKHVDPLRSLAELADQAMWGFEDERTDAAIQAAGPHIEAIFAMYRALPASRRAGVMLLSAIQNDQVLAPLALMCGKCDIRAYEDAVAASAGMLHGTFTDVSRRAEADFRKGVRSEAEAALEYVALAGA